MIHPAQSFSRGIVRAASAAFVLAVALLQPGVGPRGSELAAQSLVRAEVAGTVVDQTGRPVAETSLTLTDPRTGSEHWVEAGRDGRYHLPFLPAGEYDVLAEAFGHVPRRYRGVRLSVGRATRLDVQLEASPPPIDRVDTVSVDLGYGRFEGGTGRAVSRDEVSAYPDRRMGLGGLAALSPVADETLAAEGLPGAMMRTYLDGVPLGRASHPLQATGEGDLPLVPRLGLTRVDVHQRSDIEWSGGAGTFMSASARSGSGVASAEVFGSGTGGPLWHAESLSGRSTPEMLSGWGGVAAHVPLQENSQLFVAVEGFSSRTPQRSPVTSGLAESIIENGWADGGSPSEDLAAPWMERTEAVSGLARLDWGVGGTSQITARTNFSLLRDAGGSFYAGTLEQGRGLPFDGSDFATAVSVLTEIRPSFVLEARGGIERSQREWGGTGGPDTPSALPSTRLMDAGVLLGPDPGLAAQVSRTAFTGTVTGHLEWAGQRFKGGLHASVPSYEYQHIHRSGGEFLFGNADRIGDGEGVFMRAVGSGAERSFNVPELGLFAQHLWEPLPGIRVTTGVRADRESLPMDRVDLNERWNELTGIANSAFDGEIWKISPRIGASWDLSDDGSTIFEASTGTHYGGIDPGALNEALSLTGSVRYQRAIGDLADWPDLPGAGDAGNPVLAMLSPDLEAPQTTRARIGLSQRVGTGGRLTVSGAFRRTDAMLRRSDLNLSLQPSGQLEDGRPVYGDLRQVGSVVVAEPGTNRRFSEFDQVWALSSDGWSEFRAVTLSFEQRAGDDFDLFAGYTYSTTEDNLVGAAAGVPEAGMIPSVEEESEWDEGVSDFDVPHRITAGARVGLPLNADAAVIYRFRSGRPFTAGFRPGVDITGDGSGHNDPAFITEESVDLASCLAADQGSVARRNGCRGPGSHTLDLHLSLDILTLGSSTGSLTVELFNLLDADVGVPDGALFLVDESGTIEEDGSSGRITVPLAPNSGFGETSRSLRPGRMIRVGFRVALP